MAQITRAALAAAGLLGEVLASFVVVGEGDVLFLQSRHVLAEHERSDLDIVLLLERVEHDHLVHTGDELRAEEVGERLHDLFLGCVLGGLAEAERAFLVAGAGVGGHDDDGVLKVDGSAVRVRHLAFVEDLKQDIEHVGMRLFDLVKEQHRIRTAAHLLRDLTGFVIADIAGW